MAGKQWEKHPIQKKACALLNAHEDTLLVGGSRSTKTSIIVRNIILRAIKTPSRHLIVRKTHNSMRSSLWKTTIPEVMAGFFPGLKYKQNQQDFYITVPTKCGGTSEIWLTGIDDKDRVEKILGNEYSTIFANEVSQISYDAITTLRTRLAQNSGLTLRFYYDCNPPSKAHWCYKEFIKKEVPGTREKSNLDSAWLFMNPEDNPLLSKSYMNRLNALPKRQRDRYLKGLFLSDVEGALWNDEMISNANTLSHGDLKKVVVVVDPAVTNNKDSDEVGIVVVGVDHNDIGVVLFDATTKASTRVWAQRVVNLYERFDANCVVAEVNQGGDLVEDVLKNINRSIKVVKVRANKGKHARAEPVSELYELNRVSHDPVEPESLLELENQLTEYVPMDSNYSPGRLDGVVWGLTHLMIRKPKQVNVAFQ